MPALPRATTRLSATAGAIATGTDLIAVIAAVATSADTTPRLFSSSQALLDQHDYCEGVDYAALHMQDTKKPVLFVGLPIVTAGVVGRQDTSGNTGTSVPSVAVGASGSLAEVDGQLVVVTGGTIGTDQVTLQLSLDGGRVTKRVRLGTGNSYVIPHVGLTLSFAAGTLVADDTILTWSATAPLWNAAGLAAARAALAAQARQTRTWLLVGDQNTLSNAQDIATQVNLYETTNERFVVARAQLRDRLPLATMSQTQVRMTGSPSLTFAEVGATGDTITRNTGSFVTDGFVAGQIITVAGSALNNITTAVGVATVTATIITLDSDDLVDEGPIADCTIVGTSALTFAEVGATGDTLTRSGGSWLADGFRVGDIVDITDTVLNNIVGAAGLTGVTATIMTFDTDDLAAEVIGSFGVSVIAGETKAQHVSTMDSTFASIDADQRLNLGHGRLRVLSPILGYKFRRPVQWAASIREFQHDVHITTWAKKQGALQGWDMNDADGNLEEHDDNVDGGGTAARFTCARTWSNGPSGAFISMDLTREDEASLLSLHHNMSVANIVCSVVQANSELAIGETPTLNADGTATSDELSAIQERVNTALALNLLRDVAGEGARASSVKYTPSTDDILNIPNALLTGVTALGVRGTIVNVDTNVRVS